MKLHPIGPSFGSHALLALAAMTIAPHCDAAETGRALSGGVGIGSDYTFRGISQTMGHHTIQAYVQIDRPSGIYAYAWGSNIDFVPAREPDDGARYELDLALGFATDISDNWSADIALIRYLFPGTVDGTSYDYSELMATLWYTDHLSGTIAIANDVDGTTANSVLYELGARFEIPAEVNITLSYGHYDLADAYGQAYSYAEARLSRQFGDASLTLAYINANHAADLIFDSRVTGSRLVLSLEFEF